MYSKAEYGIYKRKMPNGKVVYYYWVYDEQTGKRLPRSTGQRTKAKALDYVLARREEGLLGVADRKSMTLNEFCEDLFIKDKCPIQKDAEARGRTVAGNTMKNRRISLDKHILPYLGKTRVSAITSAQINEWLINLPKRDKLKRTSCNQCLDALSTVMKYAIKRGIIQNNPCQSVENLGDDTESTEAFTIKEVDAIIGEEKDWKNPIFRLMCMTSAVTGMRVGEVLALRPSHVFPDHILVAHNFSPVDGLKSTKTKRKRIVPITPYLYKALASWFPSSNDKFIFSADGEKPYAESSVAYAINKRCEKLKIKGKTFHSFRAFLDSIFMAKNINETTLRKMIGHKDAKMTEHYMHMEAAEFSIVTDAQEDIGKKFLIDKPE